MTSKDTLTIWKESCEDQKIVMLIDQLLALHDTLDAERAQKIATVKAAAEIGRDAKIKAALLHDLIQAAGRQDANVVAMNQSFRKLYEICVYGNEIFQAEPLLRLWLLIEQLMASTTQEDMSANQIAVMGALQSLNENAKLVDMRTNLISYTDFINDERERNTTEDNAGVIERSNDSGDEA